MSDALSTLRDVPGVHGCALFDQEGNCVVAEVPPPHDPLLLAEVARKINAVFETFASLTQEGDGAFFVRGEDGALLLQQLSGHVLVVLAATDVNVNFVGVALNVVRLHLQRAAGVSGPAPLGISGSTFSVPHGAVLSGSTGTAPAAIPPDAVGRASVLQLYEVFALFMGPAAKPVFKGQLAALGVTTRTLRRGQWKDFVDRLASTLPSTDRRGEFILRAGSVREQKLA